MMFRISILLLAIAGASMAQQSNGYIFFAPGGVSARNYTGGTLHIGAGADVLIGKGLGANVEIGAMGPTEDFRSAVGLFSPGATYYFRRGKELKFEPFVAGGYSLMFRYDHQNLWYVGGGVNYWIGARAGLRLEFRDHILPAPCSGCYTTNFYGFRIGLALR